MKLNGYLCQTTSAKHFRAVASYMQSNLPDTVIGGLFLNERQQTTFVGVGGFPEWERAKVRPEKELDYWRQDLLAI
jgi:hypothetical protein